MPTYEYRCLGCGKRVAIYQSFEEYGRKPVHCPKCASNKLERRIGRVRVARSEESRLDSLSDPSDWGDVDEQDPRSMARMMRKMGQEMGEEMPGEFDEVVDRLESGENPDSIEQSMPDLAEGGGDEDFWLPASLGSRPRGWEGSGHAQARGAEIANLRSLGAPRVDGTPKAAWEQSVEDMAEARDCRRRARRILLTPPFPFRGEAEVRDIPPPPSPAAICQPEAAPPSVSRPPLGLCFSRLQIGAYAMRHAFWTVHRRSLPAGRRALPCLCCREGDEAHAPPEHQPPHLPAEYGSIRPRKRSQESFSLDHPVQGSPSTARTLNL